MTNTKDTTKKTGRKNRTKQTVTWPTGYFTIKQLWQQNAGFIEITLRVRLNNAIEDKTIVQLGALKASKGRPNLVFTCAPVTDAVLESARTAGVTLDESFNSVKVATVNGTKPETVKTIEAVDAALEKATKVTV